MSDCRKCCVSDFKDALCEKEFCKKYYREGSAEDFEKLLPHWIPCSERLPKEEDYRECMECLDGAVWYCTNHKTIGLGYYYYSTKEWSTINDMKPDGKVIAWMPLPNPWEGEKDEQT